MTDQTKRIIYKQDNDVIAIIVPAINWPYHDDNTLYAMISSRFQGKLQCLKH